MRSSSMRAVLAVVEMQSLSVSLRRSYLPGLYTMSATFPNVAQLTDFSRRSNTRILRGRTASGYEIQTGNNTPPNTRITPTRIFIRIGDQQANGERSSL